MINKIYFFQEKPKQVYNLANESQTLVPNEQVDRAPIIVSPNSQIINEPESSKNNKDSCKIERSVIVRAGSMLDHNNVNKISSPEVIVNVAPYVEIQNVSEEASEMDTSNQENARQENVSETSSTETPINISTLAPKISHNILLGRWKLSLDLFGRIFMEDVGLEAGSVVSELGGFSVKEAKFRRDMEKLRNSQQKDITLLKVLHYLC